MAVLMTPPYQYFADANGNPLAGGKIYTYQAGTTTPKAAYSDQSGGTPLSNPVILDSAGRAEIWIDGSYKYVVKDANDVTIDTVDNVTAFVAGTGTTIDINGLTEETVPAGGDFVPIYDISSANNKKSSIANIFGNAPALVSSSSATATALVPTGSSVPTNGMYLPAANTIAWSTNGTEKARLDASGFLFIQCTTTPSNTVSGLRFGNPASGATLSSGGNATTSQVHINFINGNGTVGSISTNGSNTAFNTSSDKRKKEDVSEYNDSGNVIDALEVRNFKWKSSGQDAYGLYAQDAYEVAPHAVSIDEERGWSIDYSKFVPDLIAEVKSLRARVAALEAA